MGDLVASLILRGSQIKQQLAVRGAADIAVRDGGTVSVAICTSDHGVLDAVGVGDGGFEIEVYVGGGGRGDESVVGESIRKRSTVLGAGLESSGRRKDDRGKEKCGDGGEAHLGWMRCLI